MNCTAGLGLVMVQALAQEERLTVWASAVLSLWPLRSLPPFGSQVTQTLRQQGAEEALEKAEPTANFKHGILRCLQVQGPDPATLKAARR